MTLIERSLLGSIVDLCFSIGKMAFVSGPRQCGKTTMAKMLGASYETYAYYNWDDITFRRQWTKAPKLLIPREKTIPLIIFDEIHKASGWKSTLKGIYDTLDYPAHILVTGSARLNVYRKGGDSLMGRYFHFSLHPFSLAELKRQQLINPDEFFTQLDHNEIYSGDQESVELLLAYGSFPEPLIRQDERHARIWRRNRMERIIREDLRDLSSIRELSRIEQLVSLLGPRVGSPVSIQSLREDLEVSHDTVKRWLEWLKELYYIFEVKPFQRRIARSIKKEGKLYFWDHGEVDDPGARFENMVGLHLLKAAHYWTDCGYGNFALNYLRNKEKQELDFLLVRDKKPWLAIEVKLSDTTPSKAWKTFLPQLRCSFGLQLTLKPNVHKRYMIDNEHEVLVVSAAHFLKNML